MFCYYFYSQATDECGFHAIAYEFVKEALLLYESDITDSKVQIAALTEVVGTLLNCQHFPTEDYEALITKVCICTVIVLSTVYLLGPLC